MTVADALTALAADPTYAALVRGNECRRDPVRRAAADDYAQETLDAGAWAIYARALQARAGPIRVGGETVKITRLMTQGWPVKWYAWRSGGWPQEADGYRPRKWCSTFGSKTFADAAVHLAKMIADLDDSDDLKPKGGV